MKLSNGFFFKYAKFDGLCFVSNLFIWQWIYVRLLHIAHGFVLMNWNENDWRLNVMRNDNTCSKCMLKDYVF